MLHCRNRNILKKLAFIMKIKRLCIALAAILIGSAYSSCKQAPDQTLSNDPWGSVSIPSGQPIHIRVAFSKSDRNIGPVGSEQTRGAELAARQFPAIQGFSVIVEESDPECSAGGGVASARELIGEQDVIGVVGMTCSSSCLAAAPLLDSAHLTSISPNCGASTLAGPVAHQASFATTSYPASLEGTVGAEFSFKELGARKVGIISYGTIESQDSVDSFRTTFKVLGGNIVGVSTVVPGQVSFGASIDTMMADQPDLIFAPLLPGDAVNFVQQLKSSRFARTTVVGGRYFGSKWLLTTVGKSAEGIYAVVPDISKSAYDSINKSYQDVYHGTLTTSEAVFAYDSMSVLLEAIKKVAKVGSEANLIIGRKALRDALQATSDYPGLTGTITCTAWGDCSARLLVGVAQARSGQWVLTFIP
jgi:branched-chain amino acid transport system substrate-binding protein